MDTKEPAVCEYSNMLLITYLTLLKGHSFIDVKEDPEDPKKSLAVFKKTTTLLQDVEDYHNDVECLFKPRSYEKHFKDIKFILNNKKLFNRK